MAIAWRYFLQVLKRQIAYRWDFVAELFGELVSSVVTLSFLFGIFAGAGLDRIGAWPRDTILFIYGFSMISFGIYDFFAESLYRFSEQYLIEGRLDLVLLRPYPPLAQVLMNDLNPFAATNVAIGVSVCAWSGAQLGLSWGAGETLAAAGLALCGGSILVSIFVLLTCVHFWFEDRLGIQPPVFNCVVFGRYPIDLFHPAVRFALRFVIPFAFIGYYPAGLFVAEGRWGPETYRLALATPLVAIVCASAAGLLWRTALRRYHSTGS